MMSLVFCFLGNYFHYVVFLTYNNFLSFAEGTMETDPGTELPGMPACLHRRWDALSRGKASMWKSKMSGNPGGTSCSTAHWCFQVDSFSCTGLLYPQFAISGTPGMAC